MLKKLMKYDLKKMFRILVYFYAICLALAGITRIINIGKNIQVLNIIGMVFSGLTYSALANILVNTFVHIIMAFQTSFYKDQSYLTHTLPVKKEKLLLSKYLSSLIVIFSSVSVCFFSLVIMFYSKETLDILKVFIQATVVNFNISVPLFIIIITFLIFSQICAIMGFGFTAMVKGYSYNHKRGIKGLLWFFIFYFGSMFATFLIAVVVFAITGNINQLLSEQLSQELFLTIIIIALVTYIVYSFLFYFICQREFKKGVNID